MGLAERFRAVALALIPRANALAVIVGLGVLVAAAFRFNEIAGLVVLGTSLIAVGVDVPRRPQG